MRNADLTDADLTGADLTDANLNGANLFGANLTDAHLRGAKGLRQEQLNRACGTDPLIDPPLTFDNMLCPAKSP